VNGKIIRFGIFNLGHPGILPAGNDGFYLRIITIDAHRFFAGKLQFETPRLALGERKRAGCDEHAWSKRHLPCEFDGLTELAGQYQRNITGPDNRN
jgi:hypothetical protein